jgi:hypothetical protein
MLIAVVLRVGDFIGKNNFVHSLAFFAQYVNRESKEKSILRKERG